ncbi:MAG: amidohydrolase family protein [Deltaproteobacteria bacterium]|nr:amidohydrolase family protein [Deltaproteobacteria bacterium]
MNLKKIIDLHVHTAGLGLGDSGCFVTPKLRRNWRYKIYLRAFGVREEELRSAGDRLAFRRISDGVAASQVVAGAVVLALDGVMDGRGELDLTRTEVYIPNDFVAAETANYPNLFFGASVNPHRCDALERLEQAVELGAVLLKWLPAIQGIDPADEALIPFYEKLKALDLPLLTHTGDERSFTRSESALGDPQRLHLPLSLGVKVIAAHAATTGTNGGERNMERLLRMFPTYPTLYADISSLTQLNKLFYLPRLLKQDAVLDRLVYGTDFPLISTALVSPWYYAWRIPMREMARIGSLSNPWDRDVELKMALSVPAEVFFRGKELLKLSRAGTGLAGAAAAAGPQEQIRAASP